MVFFISYTHLFGLSAAVVNFNRLPELMTAVCRRIGFCPSWHYFDDQGTLDFRTAEGDKPGPREAISAPNFVGAVYELVGRPFKPAKHLPARARQVHLGLANIFEEFANNLVWLEAKEGKLEELHAICGTQDSSEAGSIAA